MAQQQNQVENQGTLKQVKMNIQQSKFCGKQGEETSEENSYHYRPISKGKRKKKRKNSNKQSNLYLKELVKITTNKARSEQK